MLVPLLVVLKRTEKVEEERDEFELISVILYIIPVDVDFVVNFVVLGVVVTIIFVVPKSTV
jgi:hypothetical protein